jgi:hypothetical protein
MHTLPNLPISIAREIFADLSAGLPPLATDTPEARAARDDLAMAAVAALHPTDVMEARHAVAIVTADAYAADSLRLAGECRTDVAATLRCRAQAAALLREMRCLLRDYRRNQAERDKALEAMHPAAMQRAGWWFREASVPAPEPPAAPEPVDFSALSEAEQYALLHPERARRIRAEGGLPARLDFGPPDPDLVAALVHGTSPILLALDQRPTAGASSQSAKR